LRIHLDVGRGRCSSAYWPSRYGGVAAKFKLVARHSSKVSHFTSLHCGNGYWSQKVQLVGLPSNKKTIDKAREILNRRAVVNS